jgi:hypothetical protein
MVQARNCCEEDILSEVCHNIWLSAMWKLLPTAAFVPAKTCHSNYHMELHLNTLSMCQCPVKRHLLPPSSSELPESCSSKSPLASRGPSSYQSIRRKCVLFLSSVSLSAVIMCHVTVSKAPWEYFKLARYCWWTSWKAPSLEMDTKHCTRPNPSRGHISHIYQPSQTALQWNQCCHSPCSSQLHAIASVRGRKEREETFKYCSAWQPQAL